MVPRPIGWISTKGRQGQANLAPYSQFNNLSFDPPYVMFSANQTVEGIRKDTVVNAEATGEFVWNLATWELRDAVNQSARPFPYGVDEFQHAGVSKEAAQRVGVPMVAESPVRLECCYHTTMRLPGNPPLGTVDMVIGRVVAVHIKDEVMTGGILDVRKTQPIARCDYFQYAVIRETFEMMVPGISAEDLYGMEGNVKRNQVRGSQLNTEVQRDLQQMQ